MQSINPNARQVCFNQTVPIMTFKKIPMQVLQVIHLQFLHSKYYTVLYSNVQLQYRQFQKVAHKDTQENTYR